MELEPVSMIRSLKAVALLSAIVLSIAGGCRPKNSFKGSTPGPSTPGPSDAPPAAAASPSPKSTLDAKQTTQLRNTPQPQAFPQPSSVPPQTSGTTVSSSPAPGLFIPDYSVSRGSFTAWTYPQSPMIFQDYTIIIVVRLPQMVFNYGPDDITGTVVGTDRYEQDLADPISRMAFGVYAGYARLEIGVPGAFERRVRDRITVSSGFLQETQQLDLMFQ